VFYYAERCPQYPRQNVQAVNLLSRQRAADSGGIAEAFGHDHFHGGSGTGYLHLLGLRIVFLEIG